MKRRSTKAQKNSRKNRSKNANHRAESDQEFDFADVNDAGHLNLSTEDRFFRSFAWFRVGVIFIVAMVLRWLWLDMKPVHFDEGINGHFVETIWQNGFYKYDPTNFHGPLYFYTLQLAEVLLGRGIFAFRFINTILSLGTIYLVAQHRRFFGGAALWAAAALAVSTGAVFYGRYAIHETFFVLCQVIFSYGFFLWFQERSRKAVNLMVTGFFGTFLLKETFFIFFIIWGIAALSAQFMAKLTGRRGLQLPKENERTAKSGDWLAQIGLGVAITLIFFTGFFLNKNGLEDMFRALAVWSKTGTAHTGHEKPFEYWLQLLFRYEFPLLVALAASIACFYWLNTRQRLMALVAFGSWLAYSLIPYKTPWLILNIIWPLTFVFGFVIELTRGRGLVLRVCTVLFAFILLGQSINDTLQLNFKNFAAASEPYVYVQSTNQMKSVLDRIDKRVHDHPEDLNMHVYLLLKDPWPLPWLFSDYPHLVFGKPENVDLENPAVIFADAESTELIESKLDMEKFTKVPFPVRDSYSSNWAYLSRDKFNIHQVSGPVGEMPIDPPGLEHREPKATDASEEVER